MATPYFVAVKMHHINQSENDMAEHGIWLLRKRRQSVCTDGSKREIALASAIVLVSFKI